MNNKKGFTLVELMGVIVILAIIIAIAIPSYNLITKNIKAKNLENQKELIKVAAVKYAEDANIYFMYPEDLIKQGYLEEKDIDPSLKCSIYQVKDDKGLLYAVEIKESNSENESCNQELLAKYDDNIRIEMKTVTDKDINSNTNYWTNEDVKLSFEWNESDKGTIKEESIQWYKGDEIIAGTNSYSYIVTVPTTAKQEQLYKVKLTATKDGQDIEYTGMKFVKIDKKNPEFYNNAVTPSGDWQSSKDYSINAYDNESGLKGYWSGVNTTEDCPNEQSQYSSKKTFKFENTAFDKANLKICIMDNAGNVKSIEQEIEKVDGIQPSCQILVNGQPAENKWYIGNQMTVSTKSSITNISGTNWGISNNNSEVNYNEKSIIENSNITSKSYYGFIKSGAGLTNTCNATVKYEHDITAPVISGSSSNYNSITATYNTGSAISGIKNTTCHLTDANGNIKSNGTLNSNGSCTFSVPATSANSIYYFKKCITSNAGNSICSTVSSKTTVGYCTSGNYTTSIVNKSYTSSCPACGSGTRNYTYNEKYTSKYNNLSCGNSGTKSSSETCSGLPSCCSSTRASYGNYGGCSAVCGTGSQTRTVNYYSNYDGSFCGSAQQSSSCNTQDCCSKTHIGSYSGYGSCSVGCGGGLMYRSAYYYSDYDGRYCRTASEGALCNTQSCIPPSQVIPGTPSGGSCECTNAWTWRMMRYNGEGFCSGGSFTSQWINFGQYTRLTGTIYVASSSSESGVRCIFGLDNNPNDESNVLFPILDVSTTSTSWAGYNYDYRIPAGAKTSLFTKAICYHTGNAESSSFEMGQMTGHHD